ncbi:hypothetical protein Tco_1374739 [Tanacetum coccineum]
MLGLFDVHWSLYIQVFHGDAIMGQMLYQFQENQRDNFSNDTFRVKNQEEIQRLNNQVQSANISATLAAIDRDRIEKTQDQDGKQIRELRHRLSSAEIRLEVASFDRYRLECELYSVRAQMHAIQQELYWTGFEENHHTESIDVLATYGYVDPLELQEPSDTQ